MAGVFPLTVIPLAHTESLVMSRSWRTYPSSPIQCG